MMNHHEKEIRLPMDKRLIRVERFNPGILSEEEVVPRPHYEKDPAVAAENRAELVRRMERYANKDGTMPTIPGIGLEGSDLTDDEKRIFMLALSTVAGVFAVDDRDLGCKDERSSRDAIDKLSQSLLSPSVRLRASEQNHPVTCISGPKENAAKVPGG